MEDPVAKGEVDRFGTHLLQLEALGPGRQLELQAAGASGSGTSKRRRTEQEPDPYKKGQA